MRWVLRARLSAVAALALWGACRQNPQDAPDATPGPGAATEISAERVEHVARAHFRIRTPAATFLLDSASGGLSSMIDRDGNDWISYRPEPWNQYPASAASSYRGVPNLVFHSAFDGAGHPGHDRVRTTMTSDSTAECSTPGGPWTWTWRFHDDYAVLDVTGVSDTAGYWFLYEGPAGGEYQPRQTYMASDESAPAYPQHDHFEGEEEVARRQWYYFGNDAVARVLYMRQAEPDTLADHYSLLGNDPIGIYSPDGMVVAGFGRAPMAEPVLRTPHRFVIGFLEGEGHSEVAYGEKASVLSAAIE